MIPRINERTHRPHDPLGEALGRGVPVEGGLPEYSVVAYWPGLDSYALDDEQATWTAVQWAEHLEDPLFENPFTTGPRDDRRAIFHLHVRLHPDDRDLSGAEWAEAAHRLARASGFETPGDNNGCRWIAVQGKPGRLDLIANLIRLDGTWQPRPANFLRRLSDEASRIEQDLRLVPGPAAREQHVSARAVTTSSAQLATALSQLADERTGPLTTMRSLVEHTARRIAHQPGPADAYVAYRLELVARHLHDIQQDLDMAAGHLEIPAPPRVAAPAPPAARAPTRST
ncbi:relaxase/mobilization nuclease [Streptomyces sp. NPDC021212]|uniref:relaxase/mobilization nuclease n=1 Tax=Streptomyces sp. NPDC021212 TaxID=3365118 RepID=UPI00379E148A